MGLIYHRTNIISVSVPLTFYAAYVIIDSMSDKSPQLVINNPSRLERFSLGFEYDKTIQEVKRDMKSRVIAG